MRILNIQIGHTYRNSLGQRSDIVAKTDHPEFPFEASDGMTYAEDGRFENKGAPSLNLVAEVQTVENPSFDPQPDEEEIEIIVRAVRPAANEQEELTELLRRLSSNPLVKSASY